MNECKLIKANLPQSAEAYEQGNGEGCYFIVDAETRTAYERDEEKSNRLYFGILDNDSMDFIGLEKGERLPLEMRGEFRPVVPFEYLRNRWKVREAAPEENDIAQLVEEYDYLPEEPFDETDIQSILDFAGNDAYVLILTALKVGYMTGRSQ